jgi:hypothetical protein
VPKTTTNSKGDSSLKHTHGSTNHERKEDKAAMLIATADEIVQKGLEIDFSIAKIKKQKRSGPRIRRARRIRNDGAIDYTVNVTGQIIQYKWCGHAIQHWTGAIGGRFSDVFLFSDKIVSDKIVSDKILSDIFK